MKETAQLTQALFLRVGEEFYVPTDEFVVQRGLTLLAKFVLFSGVGGWSGLVLGLGNDPFCLKVCESRLMQAISKNTSVPLQAHVPWGRGFVASGLCCTGKELLECPGVAASGSFVQGLGLCGFRAL